MTEPTLPIIFTLSEAAERLRMSRHGLAKVARRTGHCAQSGRDLLFSEADLVALWEEMRVEPGGRKQNAKSVVELDMERRAAEFLSRRPARRRSTT